MSLNDSQSPLDPHEQKLDQASQQALDALVEAGWDLEQVSAELRPTAMKVMELMGMLDQNSAAGSDDLLARTMARIPADEQLITLSPDDARAVDAWVEAGFDAAGVAEPLRARAHKHEQLAVLLRSRAGAAASGDLAERTARLVDLVSPDIDGELAPIPISRGAWVRRRALDLVSIAAMLLVAASIMWPVLAGLRQREMQMQCNSNMQSVASAMSAYAGENRDSLPVSVASLGPQRWWDVDESKPNANSSNLYTLIRKGYTKLTSLACPGNPHAAQTASRPSASDWRSLDEISYSYQLMFGKRAPGWNESGRRLILADRSPAVLRAIAGQRPSPRENSPNHHGAGQHGLFTDGSADWLQTSYVPSGGIDGPDCIWLPRPPRYFVEGRLEQNEDGLTLTLTGRELPTDGFDVFLGP